MYSDTFEADYLISDIDGHRYATRDFVHLSTEPQHIEVVDLTGHTNLAINEHAHPPRITLTLFTDTDADCARAPTTTGRAILLPIQTLLITITPATAAQRRQAEDDDFELRWGEPPLRPDPPSEVEQLLSAAQQHGLIDAHLHKTLLCLWLETPARKDHDQ